MRIMKPSKAADHPARRNGWTEERREAFLVALAGGIDVRRACVHVGLSRQAAYKLRRRDPGFAREWQGALRTARVCAEERFLATLPEGLLEIMASLSTRCELREAGIISQDSVRVVARV
jgi:hypothetical protein